MKLRNLLYFTGIILGWTLCSFSNPQTPDDEEDVYFILSGEADRAIADSDYVTAVQRIKEALDIEPSNPSNVLLLSNLGTLYNYMNQDTLALEAFNRALALAPSMTTVLENRGRLNLKMGNRKEAYQDFSEVIARDSLSTGARFYHGIISLYGGDMEGAEADFKVLENLAPDLYSTLVAMSSLYSMTGRDREAIPYYEKLIAIDPAPEYYAALAGCHLALEHLSEAASVIDEGLKIAPEDPELYYYRARLNLDRYLLSEAREDAQRAIYYGADPRKVAALFDN